MSSVACAAYTPVVAIPRAPLPLRVDTSVSESRYISRQINKMVSSGKLYERVKSQIIYVFLHTGEVVFMCVIFRWDCDEPLV